jgi:hypothetical protein
MPFQRLRGRRFGLKRMAEGGTSGNLRYQTITVDNTSGGALSQYQARVDLTASNFNFSQYAADGADLRVYDANGKILPYYLARYDPVGQTGTLYVRFTQIGAGATAQAFIRRSSAAFVVPPTLPFTKPATAVADGLAENMVFDPATSKYYVVYISGVTGPVAVMSSASPDGPWANPTTILNLGAGGQWDAGIVHSPHLLLQDGTWYLYYTGCADAGGDNESVGVATAASVTGPYTRHASNPILTYQGAGWEAVRATEPYVYYSAILNQWVMLYMGDQGVNPSQIERVGYAVADNPIGPWTRYANNPVIDFGPVGSWDEKTVADPFCIEMDGVAYIGYTGGPLETKPWSIGFVTTTDYVTFHKFGQTIVYNENGGAWDAQTSFRGAVSKIGDDYYLPYTGHDGVKYSWGVAKVSALNTVKGFHPLAVLDFFDDFDAASLDTLRWSTLNAGTDVQADGLLTLTTGALSTFHHVYTKRLWSIGYTAEFYSRHNNADGLGQHAGELGFSITALTEGNRIFDFNAASWQKSNRTGSNTTTQNMAQAVDTGWHHHYVKRLAANSTRYQNDNSAIEEIAVHVSANALPLWMAVYATAGTTSMDVDYALVRRAAYPEPSVTVS